MNYKSKFEQQYALWLDSEKSRGNVLLWAYESVKLRIGPPGANAWYTPDFLVVTREGRSEIHETKGFRERAGMVRFKAAAGVHRGVFRFVLVQQKKDRWESKEF